MGVHWSEAMFDECDKGEDKKGRRRVLLKRSLHVRRPTWKDGNMRTGDDGEDGVLPATTSTRLTTPARGFTEVRAAGAASRDSMSQSQTRQGPDGGHSMEKKVFCGKETWCLSRSAFVVANAAWRFGLTGYPAAQLAQCFTRKSNADHLFKRRCESRFSSAHEGVVTQRRDWDFPRI